jgi:carbon-monoxide dehydrogenase medium subunit
LHPSTLRIPRITYHRPASIEEALVLKAELGPGAAFLAGGTEIVPELRRGRAPARQLISLAEVPGLSGIRRDGEAVGIGAMTTLAAVARSEEVRAVLPALADAAGWIGSVQIRERGTIGGNFCGAVPCADTPPPCISAGGRVRLVSRGGERTLPAEEFFTGPRETVIGDDEILAEVLLPVHASPGFGASYQRFGLRRGMSVAVASVAAALWIEDDLVREARIALGAVAPTPLFASRTSALLEGKEPDPEIFAAVARGAGEESRPICDVRGSDEYRRVIVETLARRALEEAAARARGERE